MKDVREALMIGRNSEGKLVRRPLSPFMLGDAYRFQISSLTSILHRITGAALGAGTILLALWLVCAVSGDEAFSIIQAFFASWVGLALLFLFTLALFYHFCNGLRHLAWDAGKGFDLPTMHRTGTLVFVGAIVLTAVFWVIAFLVW
ncbi:succinate dehydrogenase, cytochrome b556 subunit [Acidocella sp.]|uniref:succinate dehydrogenase, cytochrome b556 subunit n=1 Tax=Acidocella sp. TaxID=50710 RepID=UPI0026187EB7|nr:succinate dehydrogenase, cytochrome b556 subunit [Acidocella sp.]